ncbi:hypothetical protein P5V15_008611 [Pogonomyrmex californicus]
MPAEIDTGGHRVLHCDSHADCPTARIHVLTSASDERQTDRAHLSVRIDGKSQKKIPKDRRRKSAGNCVGKVVPLDCRRETSPSGRGKTARIPRIGDEEKTIPDERDFSEKSLALTQLSRRRREERTRGEEEDRVELREACRAIEDVIKDERFSVTWNSREDADAHDEIERAESRLLNGTERSRLAIVDASGSSITGHQSLRDRSWTRPRPSSYGSEDHDADPIDRPGRRRITEESSLLSSHRLHTRAKEEAFEDDFKDVDEGFFGKEHDDTWADGNAQLDYSGPRDERPENERGKRIVRNFEDRKRIRCACRDGSFLQLVFLLLLVVFGRHGLFDSSSVFRVNTRPITNCLSVLGFGIIGVVDARAFDSIGDTGIRAERSANLSHITGSFRKIQLYIRHRHLQILPDGTVNGSNDDTSDYIIQFHRHSNSHLYHWTMTLFDKNTVCFDISFRRPKISQNQRVCRAIDLGSTAATAIRYLFQIVYSISSVPITAPENRVDRTASLRRDIGNIIGTGWNNFEKTNLKMCLRNDMHFSCGPCNINGMT